MLSQVHPRRFDMIHTHIHTIAPVSSRAHRETILHLVDYIVGVLVLEVIVRFESVCVYARPSYEPRSEERIDDFLDGDTTTIRNTLDPKLRTLTIHQSYDPLALGPCLLSLVISYSLLPILPAHPHLVDLQLVARVEGRTMKKHMRMHLLLQFCQDGCYSIPV